MPASERQSKNKQTNKSTAQLLLSVKKGKSQGKPTVVGEIKQIVPSDQWLLPTLSSGYFRWSSYLPLLLPSEVAKESPSPNKYLVNASSRLSRHCVLGVYW